MFVPSEIYGDVKPRNHKCADTGAWFTDVEIWASDDCSDDEAVLNVRHREISGRLLPETRREAPAQG